MNALAIENPGNALEAELISAQHQLRARVFSERLGWDVEVTAGSEADKFDLLAPTYILATLDDATLVGCARLLPALGPTMLVDVFPTLLPSHGLAAHRAMIESSRFCVDTAVVGIPRKAALNEATLTMFAGILEWCLNHGYQEIVTVTDLRFERILSRVGWPLVRLSDPRPIGSTQAVAGTLPVTQELFSRLRPSGYHSDLSVAADKDRSVDA